MAHPLGTRRRFTAFVAVLSLIAVLAAACTSTKPKTAEPTTPPPAKEAIAKEAPMLAKLVADGKLPKVEDRLPKEPLVVKPVDKIGTYGGSWRNTMRGRGDVAWFNRTVGYELYFRYSPDWKSIEPNVMTKWEASPDSKTFTFTIREGLKWSDGKPFTADDIVFWYEDVLMNKTLTPTIPAYLNTGGPVKVSKVNDRTVRFELATPDGLFIERLTIPRDSECYKPAHYLKQLHPKYNQAKVDEDMKKRGISDIVAWWAAINSPWENPDLPTLQAWIVKTPLGVGSKVIFERNPYYWKVDPNGSQLPYLDTFETEVHEDVNTMVLKGLNGEIDFQDRTIATAQNKAVFTDGQKKGNYHLVEEIPSNMNMFVLQLNLNHKDPVLRQIFQDKRFRIALSHAIDRKAIIDTVYVGQGQPWQAAPRPESPFYNEQMAKQYTELDVARANKLLDEMGLTKKDSRGMRLRPDGKPLVINLEVATSGGEGWVESAELVRKHWAAVGIEMVVKTEDRTLFYNRKKANDHDAVVWNGDGGLEVVLECRYWFPFSAESNWATTWSTWYITGGKQGEEPSAPAKKQIQIYRELMATADTAAQTAKMKEILKIAQEEFWVIGTVLGANQYAIVRNDFFNVPAKLYFANLYPTPAPTNTATYFSTRK